MTIEPIANDYVYACVRVCVCVYLPQIICCILCFMCRCTVCLFGSSVCDVTRMVVCAGAVVRAHTERISAAYAISTITVNGCKHTITPWLQSIRLVEIPFGARTLSALEQKRRLSNTPHGPTRRIVFGYYWDCLRSIGSVLSKQF